MLSNYHLIIFTLSPSALWIHSEVGRWSHLLYIPYVLILSHVLIMYSYWYHSCYVLIMYSYWYHVSYYHSCTHHHAIYHHVSYYHLGSHHHASSCLMHVYISSSGYTSLNPREIVVQLIMSDELPCVDLTQFSLASS